LTQAEKQQSRNWEAAANTLLFTYEAYPSRQPQLDGRASLRTSLQNLWRTNNRRNVCDFRGLNERHSGGVGSMTGPKAARRLPRFVARSRPYRVGVPPLEARAGRKDKSPGNRREKIPFIRAAICPYQTVELLTHAGGADAKVDGRLSGRQRKHHPLLKAFSTGRSLAHITPPAVAALLPNAWLAAHANARRCWKR
jgi:hypothetical protein